MNLHSLRNQFLRLACLPFHHPGSYRILAYFLFAAVGWWGYIVLMNHATTHIAGIPANTDRLTPEDIAIIKRRLKADKWLSADETIKKILTEYGLQR